LIESVQVPFFLDRD